MRGARALIGLGIVWSLGVVGPCSGAALITIESAILRNRVVVLDRVAMRKALYVAFTVAPLRGRHGPIEVRGNLTSGGATVVAKASTSLTDLLERSGNLVFDLPYEMPDGKYTISANAYDHRGAAVAYGSRTVGRADLSSGARGQPEAAAAPRTEARRAVENEEPWVADALRSRGYVLFARSPLVYVYRESRPKRREVVVELVARGMRNATATLNVSIHTNRRLGRIGLTVSDLRNGRALLPKSRIRLSCVEPIPDTIGAPKGQYRSQPTLLRPLRKAKPHAHECSRVWIAIAVPRDLVPGKYSGTLTIAPEYAEPTSLQLTLAVEPITVEDVPGVDYCMLMTYEFVELTMPWDDGDKQKIYRAALEVLKDYRRHGMTTLCLHSPFVLVTGGDGLPVLEDVYAALRAARDAGFSRPLVWYMGHLIQTSKPRHPGNIRAFDRNVHIRRLKSLVHAVSTYAERNGYPEIIVLPIDEPDDTFQDLRGIRRAVAPLLAKAIKEAGAKSMISAERFAGSGRPDFLAAAQFRAEERRAAHDGGARYWRYDNSVTTECASPAYARHQYGYYVWKHGLDGMSSWTFQNTQNAGGIPGDANTAGLDVYLAYPSPEGPLATLKWEAIREGIDDRKLIHQLEMRISSMKRDGKDAGRYEAFLADMKRLQIGACCNADSCMQTQAFSLERQRGALIDMILRADQE